MQNNINLTLLIGPTLPAPAPDYIMNAIQSVEVTNTDSGRDGFQIHFSIGRSGVKDLLDYRLIKDPLLTPFNRVRVMVTIGVMQNVLIDGIITHHQFNPNNEPGQSTFTVTGEDVSVMMDMEEKSDTYEHQSPGDIVKKIVDNYHSFIGSIQIGSSGPINKQPSNEETTPSQTETDWAHIQSLSGSFDYIFYVEPTSSSTKAYWIPSKPDMGQPPQKKLLVNMGPDSNLNSISFQYDSMTPMMVRAYQFSNSSNAVASSPTIDVKTYSPSLELSAKPALVSQSNVKIKQMRDTDKKDSSQIQTIAQAMVDNARNVIAGSGEIDTAAYGDVLRARKTVELIGVGYSYDGKYYVKSVTHSIKLGEYKQSFSIVREGIGVKVN